MAETQKIVILNFGGQYTQLIARRVRECHVYSCVLPYDASLETIRAQNPVGVILSGGPASVLEQDAPRCDEGVYQLGVPVLGICYGMQLTAYLLGGTVEKAAQREYGRITVTMDDKTSLLSGMSDASSCWLSHTYQVKKCPAGFHPIAHSTNCPVAAMANDDKRIYGVQFHPEVTHSDEGRAVIENFLNICGCVGDWSMETYAQTAIANIREIVGDKGTVLLGLSGGVDSSVAAALLAEAVGNQLTCIFVDHGLLRKNEFGEVLESYKHMGLNVKGVNASAKFLGDLAGVTDPERKRKIIGRDFVEVFNAEAKQIENVKWLAQGTIYPDVVESASASVKGPAAMIKSHHNVGGLPEEMHLKIVEPLRLLFKDEVRRVGKSLGIDPQLLGRHPFPGPGLAIRILGDITPEKVEILQNVDKIYIDALREWGLYDQVWQAGAILLPVKSVGVMGDERTYESCVALRAVASTDGMTADWVHLPYDFLAAVSNDIINKVRGVNRVVYDISSKPPATIEWE